MDKLATGAPSTLAQDPFTDFLERAARDPTIDVDKLERLLALKERRDAQERERMYAEDMAQLQAELPQIGKRGVITTDRGTRKFARLEDIDEVVRPLMDTYGFAVSYNSEEGAKGTKYTCTVRHRAGYSETKAIVLPIDSGPGRNAIQSVGSTTSYARRYLLEMHLNLVKRDEDDDGDGGRAPITAEQAAELRTALKAAEGNEARFLNWAAAASFEEIAAGNFDRCRKFIAEKGRAPRG